MFKKKIAILLATVIIFSNINVSFFANSATELEELMTETLVVTEGTTSSSSIELVNEEVIFNTGKSNVTVGFDVAKNEANGVKYKLFEDDKSYIIEVENNAFFPYEVQFTYGGETFTKWFDTPESIVEIGEYSFSIYSYYDNSKVISQLGFWINEEKYISVYPEEKVFTDTNISTRTLLPIDRKNLILDLEQFNIFEIHDIQLSVIIDNLFTEDEIDNNDVVLYSSSSYEDDFTTVDDNFALSLLEMSNFQLLIGSGKQLDLNNVKYSVYVNRENFDDLLSYEIKAIKDEKITSLNIMDTMLDGYKSSSNDYIYHRSDYYISNEEYNFSDSFQVKLVPNLPSEATFEVYDGYYNSVDDAEASENITSEILGGSDEVGKNVYIKKGYNANSSSKTLSIVVNYNEVKTLIQSRVTVEKGEYVHPRGVEYSSKSTYPSNSYQYEYANNIEYHKYKVKNHIIDDKYSVSFYHRVLGNSVTSKIVGAFVGNFDTLEEARLEKTDIKSSLFSWYGGFESDYSGEGVTFTAFTDTGRAFKFNVVIDVEYTVQPDPGEVVVSNVPKPGYRDPVFTVQPFEEDIKSYILPYDHDTYYAMGYQTLFIQDKDFDLSSTALKFNKGKNISVYSGHDGNAGVLQISEKSEQDFSNKPVQYAAVATNDLGFKNYWITVVKQQSGPSLFINGINGDDGLVREVFLTGAHNYLHDIFVANIGDEDITNLNVELIDGVNIELDEYWNIGGENNNVLGAFIEGNIPAYSYYLNNAKNIGKVRLVSSNESSGEISGVLKFSGDNIEPVEVILTGNVGNPSFVTEVIPDGVKYVPYAVQIMQNNKYYWNTVSFEITNGVLPKGLVLKENGEIYGVPKEVGEFSITVKLKNSDTRLGSSTRTFDFVIAENTNENVTNATDNGYELKEDFGEIIDNERIVNVANDIVFYSLGEFDEFIDFWFNGEKLIKGVDYIAEDGSTKITVKSQTLKRKSLINQTNTVAAEFRVNGDINNDLRRTSENFKAEGVIDDGNYKGAYVDNSNSDDSSDDIEYTVSAQEKKEVSDLENKVSVKAELKDDVYEVNILSSLIDEVLKLINQNDNTNLLELDILEVAKDAKSMSIILTKDAIAKLSKESKIEVMLNIEDIITLTLNKDIINSLLKLNNDITIKIRKDTEGVLIEFYVNGELISENIDNIKIALFNVAEGEVIILVEKDGEVGLIKKSVVDNKDVYAMINGSGKIKVINNSKSFVDVEKNAWYLDVINQVNSRKLFLGVDEENFAPNLNMSRAMIASVLQRLEDVNTIENQVSFNDTMVDQWYSDSVAWVSSVGIMMGNENSEFLPNNNVTREELAVILYNYANYLNLDTSNRGDVTAFVDNDNISIWANDAVLWSIDSGLIKGDGMNINPKNPATRAEVAAIIMRFIKLIVK